MDQMGPESAKSFAGQAVVKAHPCAEPEKPAQRAKVEIGYGRRGKGYIFGALRPASGEVLARDYRRRTIVNWVDFLEQTDEWIPGEVKRIYAILDNLSVHRAADVLLFSLHHPRWEFVFQPRARGVLEPD